MEQIELIARKTESVIVTVQSLLSYMNYITEKNLDTCLQFLHKLKKLIYFTTKIEMKDVKCVKYLNGNENDSKLEEKDTVILNLQHSINKLERKENELHEVMDDLTRKIKENLLRNQRDVCHFYFKVESKKSPSKEKVI